MPRDSPSTLETAPHGCGESHAAVRVLIGAHLTCGGIRIGIEETKELMVDDPGHSLCQEVGTARGASCGRHIPQHAAPPAPAL